LTRSPACDDRSDVLIVLAPMCTVLVDDSESVSVPFPVLTMIVFAPASYLSRVPTTEWDLALGGAVVLAAADFVVDGFAVDCAGAA